MKNYWLDQKKVHTWPHIYGWKTPEKHAFVFSDDGPVPASEKRWKRLEIPSTCCSWMFNEEYDEKFLAESGDQAKFTGKFQEACQINWNFPRSVYCWHDLYGWNWCQHCHCDVCTKQREEKGLARCTKEDRCEACIKKDKKPYVRLRSGYGVSLTLKEDNG